MIPGFGGHLVPEAFVEQCLDEQVVLGRGVELQRRLAAWVETARRLGPVSALRAIADVGLVPLAAVLGLCPTGDVTLTETYALVPCVSGAARVLLLGTFWGASLDPLWREAVREGARQGAGWCLLFNGTHVRLVASRRSHSRRFVEISLEAAADDVRAASALWLLFGATALGAPGHGRPLEGLMVDADRFAVGVCASLRAGVLDASTHVLRALVERDRQRAVVDVFEQSLTIVYRLLFLLFAEARGLVPLWHPIYRRSYSIEALREAALDRTSVGLWDALRAVTRLAHAGCRAGGLEVTAFNGRLFSPARTPLAERRGLDDAAARRAIVAVSTRPAPDGEARQRISYRDLGVEQLGAVYETLLDYVPHVERAPRGRSLDVSLRPGSGVRKSTGTFYTPQPLVDYLVCDTLSPLVRDASPEQILGLRVLDPSMGSGAFLVGACQFLASAYEAALVEHGRCHPSDIGPSERAASRRLVAERCLFGVDINPTAVQLARLSIWLATLASDRPLTFLDHHLRVGDSLSGTWLARLREPPTARRARADLPLFPDGATSDAIRHALPVRFRLALTPNDTAAQVREKERALAELAGPGSPLAQWTRVADLWCASWLGSPPLPSSAFPALSDAVMAGRSALPAAMVRDLLDRAASCAQSRRLFHWELEFPEVFFEPDGQRRADAGFDAVLGNPPWDMVRADGAGDRAQARADGSAFVRFARDAGVFDVRPDGQVNRYQLFVDRAVALTRPGGRVGLVLPAGILTDAGSGALRRLLFSRCAVERVVGFDNRAGTFPIHRSVKFVLLSARRGSTTREIECRFGESDAAALERIERDGSATNRFPVRVTPALLTKISGDDLSLPDFRSPTDLAIAERAAELFRPLGAVGGWHVHFGRELNATEDRQHFRSASNGHPVFEGKMIEPFQSRAEHARWRIAAADADRLLGSRWRRARLAYRDVASATNKLTLIAALLPAHSVSTHTVFCLKEPLAIDRQHLLCALLNSLVVNFLVRLRVSTHVTTSIVERLPVPREDEIGPSADALTRAAQTLSRAPDPDAYVRLNVRVARLYQLTDVEFARVLDTFPLIDASERAAMFSSYRSQDIV